MEELEVDALLGAELPGPVNGCWPISAELVMRVWFARPHGAPVATGDHDQVRWLAPAQWDDVAWLPADRLVVARLRKWWLGLPAASRPPR